MMTSRVYAIFDMSLPILPVKAKGLEVYENLTDAVAGWNERYGSWVYRALLKESPFNRQLFLKGMSPGKVALWTPGRGLYNWVKVPEEQVRDELTIVHMERALEGQTKRSAR